MRFKDGKRGVGSVVQMVPAFGLIVLAASMIPVLWQGNAAWGLRLAAFGFWVSVTVSTWRPVAGARPTLASPIYLLPTLALLFYSLVPAFVITLVFGDPIPIPPGITASRLVAENLFPPNFFYDRIRGLRAIASPAELLILRFAVAGLLVAWLTRCRVPVATAGHADSRLDWAAIVGAGLALAAFAFAKPLEHKSGLAREAAFAGIPAFNFCLAWLAIAAAERRVWPAWARFAGLAVVGFPVMAKGAVKPIAIMVAAAATALFASSRSRQQFLGFAVALIAVPVFLSIHFTLRMEGGLLRSPAVIWDHFVAKAGYRQSDTIFCAEFALRDDGDGKVPLYFLAAAVPRAIWPDKPSLSAGSHYAIDYCGMTPYDVALSQHSASISLLGEPWVRGGPAGLAVALLLLLGGLAWMSWCWQAGHRAGAAIVLALSPWTLDFDQHFALYLANILKASMAMIPLAVVAVFAERRLRRG